jgi:HAD superfamily hydrolase (TIGR01509 family)
MGKVKCVLFDWGDTVMRDMPSYDGPMYKWPQVEAVPGALEAIHRIKTERVLAIATNALESTEAEIRMALARVKLADLFDKIYCYRNVGALKPTPFFFDFILNDLRMAAEDTIMVGDDFQRDIMGAARCGIFGFWLNQESSERRVGKLYDTIYNLGDLQAAVIRREEDQ